jgi:hypothetical protein
MTPLKLFLVTICITSSAGFIPSPSRYFTSSRLHAEEDAAQPSADEPPADHALPSEDSSDILNSPAFLQRKVEVLQGDLTKLDASIEEANAVFEANKAEWG